jgi:Flp pilus assembly protein TadG
VVEFALVLPVLMALLLGIVSAGITFNQEMQLTHAAREGARWGASVPASQSFTSGTWASNVRDLIVQRSAGELGGTGTTVCVAMVEGTAGSTTTPLGVITTTTPSHGVTYFSTSGAPCIDDETYPVTPDDPGRRVQVVVAKPGKIEALFATWYVTLQTDATAKSEVDK